MRQAMPRPTTSRGMSRLLPAVTSNQQRSCPASARPRNRRNRLGPTTNRSRNPAYYVTLNFLVLVTEPPGVVTVIVPFVAPTGTFTFSLVAVSFVIVAD